MSFATHTVGRSKSADVVVDDNSISRLHLEITQTDDDHIFVVDRASTHGTYVLENKRWLRHKQGYLGKDVKLKLGNYECILHYLLLNSSNRESIGVKGYEPFSVRPRRNSITGEVE